MNGLLELTSASIGRLLNEDEVTVDGLRVRMKHDGADALLLADAPATRTEEVRERRQTTRDALTGKTTASPYWRTANYAGTCKCGAEVEPGGRIKYDKLKPARQRIVACDTCDPRQHEGSERMRITHVSDGESLRATYRVECERARRADRDAPWATIHGAAVTATAELHRVSEAQVREAVRA